MSSIIGKEQILVKVKAVGINPPDWKIIMGEVKVVTGKKFPKSVGCDFSGTIGGNKRDGCLH
ncbi:NADPH:quinone reductase-like Zn-dependent oxidoreductase [Chitinophaga sp. W3I9]|uniref:alcohol dehydrogenase catalytic domain-containing protein n=1 Tax=unclassified Chitinophaga TaxID=2619133 RepID=UPI003D19025D